MAYEDPKLKGGKKTTKPRSWGTRFELWLLVPYTENQFEPELFHDMKDAKARAAQLAESGSRASFVGVKENYFEFKGKKGHVKMMNATGAKQMKMEPLWTSALQIKGQKVVEPSIGNLPIREAQSVIEAEAGQLAQDLEEKRQELERLETKKEELEDKMSGRDDGGTDKQQERLESLEGDISEVESEIEELESQTMTDQDEPKEKEPAARLYDLRYDENAGYPRFRGYHKPYDPTKPSMGQTWEDWDEEAYPLTDEQKSLARLIYHNENRISRIQKIIREQDRKEPGRSHASQERLMDKLRSQIEGYSKRLKDLDPPAEPEPELRITSFSDPIPKTLMTELKKHPEYYVDVHAENGEYWLGISDEYFVPDMGCRTIHEHTVEKTLKMIKNIRKAEPGE